MFPISLGTFILCYVSIVFVIAFFGIIGFDTGLRQLYIKGLLKVFEYGRVKIQRAALQRKVSHQEDDEDSGVEHDGNSNDGHQIIHRETLVLAPGIQQNRSLANINGESSDPKRPGKLKYCSFSIQAPKELNFSLLHSLDFVKAGVEAIIQDEVTQRFDAEELQSWNLLTRTNQNYEFISVRLTLIWVLGFLLRYIILFPFRVMLTATGGLTYFYYEAIIKYHDVENRPKGGICVANHTSPIDVVMLHCDNVYSLVGQRHGGFLGVLQTALIRASSHLWFERSELKDRKIVADRMKEHVADEHKPPILIFPEGTCINNTSVMQFKKGSFDIGAKIWPVAIKYDPRFGDAFWNSSRDNYLQYLSHMLSSWATVVDIWYLPPMEREDGESAVDFANRVKSEIARKGGLVDLVWDGQLKRMHAKEEWKAQQQELFASRFKTD
ncbi:unnamed protein product [Notodromas monacha]|uniref:Phospholipid/glycerol acyltransferase domain-containing protein n=1 Tax=Notodromas monacha TaxID=399045 RepID=A0A7R9BDX9_9CRUS|nr:unnamed protein product [Notodromas monacha]CAG0913545.1 unnamed protein product [Notodromas monacha]